MSAKVITFGNQKGGCGKTISATHDLTNQSIKIYGILPAKIDIRRLDTKDYLRMIKKDYQAKVFTTIVKQQAAIGRLAYAGFTENPEVDEAVYQYKPFIKELLKRASKK